VCYINCLNVSYILAHAQGLVYILLGLMPSNYQRDSLQALLGLFLQAQRHQESEYCQVKSASALSRFLKSTLGQPVR
jgi:hypothetical protein